MRIPAAFALLAGSLVAQTARPTITPCSGGIGTKIDYRIDSGLPSRPFLPYLLFYSLKRGNFPMAAVDPKDTRSLGVGFDLLFMLMVGAFDSKGQSQLSLPIPNDPGFAGLSMLNQVLTFPGNPTVFGPMSEVSVVPFEVPGAWRFYRLNTMLNERAWLGSLPLSDSRILLTGGGRGALLALQAFKSTSIYDPATRNFTPGPDLTSERGLHTTAPLQDGRFILAGGVNATNDPQKTCDFYVPKTNKFVVGPAMASARTLHTSTLLKDGRILVCGGLNSMNGGIAALGSALNTTEIFDPKTSIWSPGPKMSEPKAAHTAHRLQDGSVLIVGGITYRTIIIIKVPSFTYRAEVYDPTTNKITQVTAMKFDRGGHSGAVMADGRVIIVGGAGNMLNGGTPRNEVEIYSPTTNTWKTLAPMNSKRAMFGSGLLLKDGRFLVAGGATGLLSSLVPIPMKQCEIYDPTLNKWTNLAPMAQARATHILTQLPSCAVVSIGGGSTPVVGNLKDHEILYQ